MSQFKKYKLKNGVKIILAPMKNTRAVTTMALLPFGSRFEKKEEAGIAHFIEHMLFKGTKKRPSALAITKELDALGAAYNAFTSRDSTGYWIKILKESLPQALDILSDIFFNSLFNPQEVEKEKGVILEEIRLYQDNPALYIYDLFYETFFGEHPLGRNVVGKIETISAINREKLLNFKENLYQPNNLLLVLAGPVKEKDLILIEKYFGQKGKGEKRKFEKFVSQPHPPQIKIVNRQEIEQVQLMLGFPGLSYFSPERETLEVFSILFGGNMSSRLFQEVREKRGLAYSVGCSWNSFAETGVFIIEAGVDPKKVEETLKVIIEEIKKIKKEGPTEEEIGRSQKYIIRLEKLSFEDSMSVASWYGHQALHLKKIETPEEKFKKIKAVTKEKIKKLAQKIFNKNYLSLSLIGPLKKENQFLEILKNLN
ncbi:MAG: M16 family metallopeptidase [Patescibacteria group bacterium]